ncbi:hypothetical protein GCM10009802_03040 [Streptomyces synnematoformans]|uniref:Transcriptional regulator WhiB n=1 Tax=Streptomyces synnematoformans TaxID=415721 RepID=A0ABN2XCV9_9ACTN
MSSYTGRVPDSERPHHWRDDAACRDEDPDLFFPVGNTGPFLLQIEEAKAVCRRCPVSADCLAYALDTNQAGVWGAMSDDDRRLLKRRRARRAAIAAAAAVQEEAPECGTVEAYELHRRRHQAIDTACRLAHLEAEAEQEDREVAAS